ncbi:DUF169 domain-containing protein [bacterium]|nr:DUF169 domain-containing protein [bacterium]
MKNLESIRKAGKKLYETLHLSTYPVAIKYIKDKSEIPEGVMQPSLMGKKMALCQAFFHSRKYGMSVAMTADDNFCTPSTGFHQWVDIPLETLLESQVKQGWHKDEASERRRIVDSYGKLLKFEAMKPKTYCGFVCSPLPETLVDPDSILVYCDGAQLTHLIHALSYEYKHVPVSQFDGFGESCVKGGLLPFITKSPQVVIPGAGDRSFALIQDHEVGIGIPGSLLDYTLENMFKTGGSMNAGFPLKSMINMNIDERITPGFQFLRAKFDEQKE